MKKILVLVVLSTCLMSCGNNANCSDAKSKYEIELNISNFATYFDFYFGTDKTNQNYYILTMSGCLDYAIYDNCQVNVEQKSNNYGNQSYTLKLNAHGNGELRFNNYYDATNTITGAMGRVIYWM